jgi:plastocyanin
VRKLAGHAQRTVTALALAATVAALAAGVTASTAAAARTGDHRVASSIRATTREYAIALTSRTVKRGRLTIHVHDSGTIAHAISISGPGLAEASTPNVNPGGDVTLTVNLRRPGRYTVWCPIPGHREAGMHTTLVVR